MKALILSLVIAFTGSIASAAICPAAGSANSKTGALTRSDVKPQDNAPKTQLASASNSTNQVK